MPELLQGLPLYLLLGAVAGLLAGLLGVGGGLIIVPALLAIFSSQSLPAEQLMHLALGTSLASIVFTSLSSVYAHQQHKAIVWQAFWQLTPGILLGSYLGGWLASQLSSDFLRPVFALFEISVGLYMLSGYQIHSHKTSAGIAEQTLGGSIIGAISAIVGIGGGTMTVPFLLWQGQSIHRAIATSAACGLPIAIAGSLSYLVNGWSAQIPAAAGYIYLPALLGIIISSMLFAPLGARLAHRLPVLQLKRIFALLLLLIGLRLLF